MFFQPEKFYFQAGKLYFSARKIKNERTFETFLAKIYEMAVKTIFWGTEDN